MATSSVIALTDQDRNDILASARAARSAADGDSNDREIEALQEALETCLSVLEISDEEVEAGMCSDLNGHVRGALHRWQDCPTYAD